MYSKCYTIDYMAKGKSKDGWGGTWTEEKLVDFEKYVSAYLKIMNKYRDIHHWKLIYMDAFAGSGMRESKKTSPVLFDEPEASGVYRGAAERVLSIPLRGFDYYYFIDSDKKACDDLRQRLQGDADDPRLQFRHGNANDYIKSLGNTLQANKKYKSLALLDPFGMQVNWEALTHLKNTDTDLWVLVPSGVVIGRLLKNDGSLRYPKRLECHLGLSEKEIKDRFYSEKTEKTLLGDVTTLSKFAHPTRLIAELYRERLTGLFKHVAAPKPLLTSRGFPIYHFVFASNNATAQKIADYIIGKGKK